MATAQARLAASAAEAELREAKRLVEEECVARNEGGVFTPGVQRMPQSSFMVEHRGIPGECGLYARDARWIVRKAVHVLTPGVFAPGVFTPGVQRMPHTRGV